MPHTDDSLILHLLRCILVYQLLFCSTTLPNLLDFGMYVPQMMTQAGAAPELMTDLVCACRNSCDDECICCSNEQTWTEACDCKTSKTGESLCRYLFTILATAESEDSVEIWFSEQ